MEFFHCQFDCTEECSRHQQPCAVPTSPMHNALPNPNDHVNPSLHEDCAPSPVQSPGSPMHSKRRRKSVKLSPVMPNRNDKPYRQMRNKPNVKVTSIFTRSMVAKANAVKFSVKNNKDIETVVLDGEENGSVLHDDPDMDPEPVIHPVEHIPHIFDKDPQMNSVPDPQIKGKSIEGNLPGTYRIGEAIHPLFINCLLDKIRKMEVEITEMVARSDVVKAENVKLQERSDSADKCILPLKRHKNKLIQRVMRLQHENRKNEERVRELNAQVTLMQLKGHS